MPQESETIEVDVEALPEVLAGHWTTAEGREMARRYATMARSDIGLSDRPDFALANAIFLVDRDSLDLGLIQTAAKERIRWLSVQLAISEAARLKAEEERADQLHEVVVALYKAWPDAEDMATDWPLGVIGRIEDLIAERNAAELRASKAEEREKVLVEALPACVAQLRHAYTHLAKGGVTTQAAFAEGLIAPEIRRLEKLLSETADQALPKDAREGDTERDVLEQEFVDQKENRAVSEHED